jgi:hypothetical protein
VADIVSRIPFQISAVGTTGAGGGGSYNLQDYQFDYALGGIPFFSATRDAWPYTEGMAPIRKDQFDNFAEPGEQSLQGWWLRSQSNFSFGAGILYQDPDSDNQFSYRFHDSLGVDPWVSGELSLLKQMNNRYTLSSTFNKVRGYVDPSGVDAAWYTDGSILWKVTQAGRTNIATTGMTGTVTGLSSTGSRYFLSTTTGIYSGVDTAAITKMYDNPTGTYTRGALGYAKDRIIAAFDNSLYAVPIQTGASTVIPATALLYTHPDPSWVWTSITEGPAAIYASGQNTTMSAVYKFVGNLDATGESFIPTVTAQMPYGETINDIYGYIGSFMGIATSKGFRVGEFDSNGDVAYGPLLFQPTGGCSGIVGYDRFMWTGSTNAHDGSCGTYRVDLGTTIQEQTTKSVRYAYARDAYASGRTGSVSSVAMLGASKSLVFPVTGFSLWTQDATVLYPSGYLETGRVRFNTEEPKLFKFVSLRTPNPLGGNVTLSVVPQSGPEITYITYTPSFPPTTNDVGTPEPAGPQNYISLKFTLGRNATDTTMGGVLNGWQIKALPGSIRQRLIQHTWLLFDEEADKAYQRVGTDGYARQRFTDFQSLARAGDVVVFQELEENLSTLVVIDDWKFTQTGPPGPNGSALGGYLTVTLRTVAEST